MSLPRCRGIHRASLVASAVLLAIVVLLMPSRGFAQIGGGGGGGGQTPVVQIARTGSQLTPLAAYGVFGFV